MYRNLRVVPQLIFGRGGVRQLGDILAAQRNNSRSPVVFLVDRAHRGKPFVEQLPVEASDLLILVNVDTEPKTTYVDELTRSVKDLTTSRQPCAVVGIGGGSTMDIAKAVALMLTNQGSSSDYQGWNLVSHPGVYHIGIPTLAGTGSEVSRTTVLTGPTRKLGINSDFTVFDQIILDPDLLAGAPRDQRFYTAMDSFIHASEALHGTFINELSRGFAEKSQAICREVFLADIDESLAEEMLMVASYFGGMSIAYSQVGICHALCYGLSYILGVRHGIGNCIVFDYLEEYYPEDIRTFRAMMQRHDIELPRGLTKGLTESQMDQMISVSLSLHPLWENALGPDWQREMTRERVRELYLRM